MYNVSNTSKRILEIFAQNIGFVSSLNNFMTVLETDRNVYLLEMNQYQNT